MTSKDKQPASDTLPECREAFEKWCTLGFVDSEGRFQQYDLPHIQLKCDAFQAGWLSSRAAFVEEFVKRLEKLVEIDDPEDSKEFSEGWAEGALGAIAIIRQMAG